MKKVEGSGRKKRIRSMFEDELFRKITDMGKPDGNPYSEKSVRTYTDNLFNFSKHFLGKAEVWSDLKWLNDTDNVIKIMNSAKTKQGYDLSVSTKTATYNSMVVSLLATGMIYADDDDNIVKIYSTIRDGLYQVSKMVNGNSTDNQFNTSIGKNQKAVMDDVKQKDILDMVNKMITSSFDEEGELINRKLYMIATMFKIHSEFPFRNDIADVKIVKPKTYEKIVKEGKDKEFNWLIFGGWKNFTFILNKFKTQNKYGTIIAKVEDKEVQYQLKRWILLGTPEEFDNTFLFTWDDGRPLSRNNISVLLTNESKKDIFLGKPVSTTLLAKIFNDVSDNYKLMNDEDKQKLVKQAGLRGHSLSTHFTIYKNTGIPQK